MSAAKNRVLLSLTNEQKAEICRPRCFRNPKFYPNSVCDYFNNPKAWQTQETFTKWVERFNNYIRLHTPDRKILLIIDNATSHIYTFNSD